MEHNRPHSAVIVGCGYTGCRLAGRLLAADRPVTAVSRRRPAALPPGARHLRLDLDAPAALRLPACDSLFYLAPPPGRGTGDPRLAACLEHLEAVRHVVYVSTSGVYGDCGGALVDEEHRPDPQTDRARRRLAAEAMLQRWAQHRGVSWCVLRVPGIYGPGRLPLERLRDGEPFLASPSAPPGNRIWVEDLVNCLLAADGRRAAGRIYNVGDGDYRSATAFAARVAELAGLPVPREISAEQAGEVFSEQRRSFLSESRRLDSSRIRRELGVEFTAVDAGLRQSLPGGK